MQMLFVSTRPPGEVDLDLVGVCWNEFVTHSYSRNCFGFNQRIFQMKIKDLEIQETEYSFFKDHKQVGKVVIKGERVYIYLISHNIPNLIYHHVIMGNGGFAPQEKSYWLTKATLLLEQEFPE
jgi:hypothetical protein